MDILQSIRQLSKSLPLEQEMDASLREQALQEARKLLLALEKPSNVVARVCFQTTETVAISMAIKIRLFDRMQEGEQYSRQQLVDTVGIESLLLERILRMLVSFGALDQAENGLFELNTVSKTFKIDTNKAGMEFCLEFLTPGWLKLPEYLEKTNWRSPVDAKDLPFHLAYNKPKGASFWDILYSTSHVPAAMKYIASFNEDHVSWLEFYPVEQRLIDGANTDPESVAMVDVGGGLGLQAINLKARFPQFKGRFIVQDLPDMVKELSKEGIEFMAHDFTTEQPVKGARLYYLCCVPHDWPQEFVVNMIKHLKDAMKPGYSRLIINEWVLPELGTTRLMAAQDLNMMCLAGMERTEAMHRYYLEKAGLKINKIYSAGDMISESVIEAEVA